MKLIFNIVHGFLESQDSNWAKTPDFALELQKLYPEATITEHKQIDFDKVGFITAPDAVEICIGNSWGASAIVRRMDKNPGNKISLAIFLDPVCNSFDSPKQISDKEWVRRQNIGHVLSFRETASILKGQGLRPGNREIYTGMRDEANRFSQFEYGWATEYVLDNDPNQKNDFLEHFTILSANPWVKQVMCDRIAKAVAAVTPPPLTAEQRFANMKASTNQMREAMKKPQADFS